MSKVQGRYFSAVNSGNLRSNPNTYMSDSDMLGAAGFAARGRTVVAGGHIHKRPPHPLAVGLARLFAGDDREARQIVAILSSMAWGKAKAEGVKLKRVQADDMASHVLAWFRHGTCKACGGHGYKVVGGLLGHSRAVISDAPCDDCEGAGKVSFLMPFTPAQMSIARWLREEVEIEQSVAGAEIMKALGPMF